MSLGRPTELGLVTGLGVLVKVQPGLVIVWLLLRRNLRAVAASLVTIGVIAGIAAIGGLGALLAKQITAASVIAYEDLGPEALYALDITAFPAVVIIDARGQNFHESARAEWRRPALSERRESRGT